MSAAKPVIAIDRRTGTELRFASMKEAARHFNCLPSSISYACTCNRWSYKGYYFKREDDDV